MLLSDAIDQYVAHRKANKKSPRTIRNDKTVLRNLLAKVGNIQVHNIGPTQMDRFWEGNSHWVESSFNVARAQLASFFQWCRVRGHLPRTSDPLEGVSLLREPVRAKSVIPVDKFPQVLDAARSPRTRAMTALGLYLFTRISETQAITWRDVDFEAKTVLVYREKTKQADELPMCEELEDELRRWRLAYANEAGELPHSRWYVIPSYTTPKFTGVVAQRGVLELTERSTIRPTAPVSYQGALAAVKQVLTALELDKKGEGTHTLRRSGATALYHQLSSVGHDRAIRMCQAMLGHAGIETTERYLQLDLDRKVRNDLLRGKPMFPTSNKVGGKVIELGAVEGRDNGETSHGAL